MDQHPHHPPCALPLAPESHRSHEHAVGPVRLGVHEINLRFVGTGPGDDEFDELLPGQVRIDQRLVAQISQGFECFTVRYRSGAVFEFDLVGFGRSNVRILRGLAPPSPPETSPTARTHSEAPAPSAESTHRHQFLAPQPAVSIRIEGDQRGDRIGDFLARQFAVSVGVQCGHDREIVENSGRTERTAPSTGPAAPSKPATRSTSPTTATFPAPATAAAKGADLGRQLRAAQHAVIVRVEGDQGVGCIENFGPREFSVPVGIHRRHHRHDNDGTPAPILRADHRGSECERNNTEPDKQDISCAGPDEARVLDHGNNQSTDTADEPC